MREIPPASNQHDVVTRAQDGAVPSRENAATAAGFKQGVDDVKGFRMFDDDTKCVLQVRGGPSNVDNDLIGKCAKYAHDLIGPDQIKTGPT